LRLLSAASSCEGSEMEISLPADLYGSQGVPVKNSSAGEERE